MSAPMRAILVLGLVAAIAFAGCLGGSNDSTTPTPANNSTTPTPTPTPTPEPNCVNPVGPCVEPPSA